MCLTIPKKIIDIKGDIFIVEDFNGNRQELKSIVELEKGDYVLSQQNVIIEKIEKNQAEEMIKIFKSANKE